MTKENAQKTEPVSPIFRHEINVNVDAPIDDKPGTTKYVFLVTQSLLESFN